MRLKSILNAIITTSIALISCSKSYNCVDPGIKPTFVGFTMTELDSLVLRQYKPNTNFQTLLGISSYNNYRLDYFQSNDTIRVFFSNPFVQIVPGYDWQLYIPSKNRIVSISNITSNHKTGYGNWGIFKIDPGTGSLPCENDIFSYQVDGKEINVSSNDSLANAHYYGFFINN